MNKLTRKLHAERSYYGGGYGPAPEFVSLIITHRCNFRCAACSIWKKGAAQELDKDNWLKIAKALKDILPPGTFIEVNGGEPLLRPELTFDLIRELKKSFRSVTLNSNGSLISSAALSELEKAGLDTVKISLYSLDPEIHDSLRGVPGSHAKACAAIKAVSRSKVGGEAGILITSRNIAGIPDLIGFLRGLGNITPILQPLDESIGSAETEDGTTNTLDADLWPDRKSVNRLFDRLKKERAGVKNSAAALKVMREYYLDPPSVLKYRCFAGQRGLVIGPRGDVSFCFKRAGIGNAAINDIAGILKGPGAVSERRAIRRCGKYCRIVGCNFSRGFGELFRSLF